MSGWYAERTAWRLVGLRYLPALAGLSLAWEVVQLPLYTLWREAPASWIAFSVVHCTLGDVLIGVSALAAALVLLRAREPARWNWARVAILTVVCAAAYTVFSEWMNAGLLRNWDYSERMPLLTLGGLRIGLSPLLQWVLIPPSALWFARKALRRKESDLPFDS